MTAANDYAHAKGLSVKDVVIRYTEWAEKYEQDLNENNYRGPSIAAAAMTQLYPPSQRSKVNILDVAAGSGLAGEKLHVEGFTSLDALEPSEGMLKLAERKGIYGKTFREFFTGQPTTEIEAGAYDAALICGGMGEGHIPCAGLDEMTRVVRSGGHAVIVMREQYLTTVEEYNGRLESKMKEMEEVQGLWEAVYRKVVPKYSFDNNGVVFVFKVKAAPCKR